MTQEENHHEQGQDAEEEAHYLQVCIRYLSEGRDKENMNLLLPGTKLHMRLFLAAQLMQHPGFRPVDGLGGSERDQFLNH